MKVVILNSYLDKGLERTVEAGEILDLDEDRIDVLSSIGVDVKEYDEDSNDEDLDDEDSNDEDLDDEDSNDELIELYKSDKNIVDELLAPDLKILCEAFEVSYTNVADAKEALKILTIG